jgi:hypothetical protein
LNASSNFLRISAWSLNCDTSVASMFKPEKRQLTILITDTENAYTKMNRTAIPHDIP